MIGKHYLYRGESHDPHYNLAVEQRLLETVEEGACILYLWQNENTVVVGRNQNPWKECRTTLLEEEGGRLARRLSGGGAVFHDLGNLNFTFLMRQADYDLERQLLVIQEGVRSLGIRAEKSGRNDLLAEGRKFSGNAFYKNGKQAYHHGTLLVDADMQKLSRYLQPSKAKLEAKGVDSVRSRVVNLRELNSEITISKLEEALVSAFGKVYGLPVQTISTQQLGHDELETLTARNRSWEWNYGQKLEFSVECEDRFSWGSIQVTLQVEHGVISQAKIYSDAMEWELAPKLEQALAGCRLVREEMKRRIVDIGIKTAEDICGMIERLV